MDLTGALHSVSYLVQGAKSAAGVGMTQAMHVSPKSWQLPTCLCLWCRAHMNTNKVPLSLSGPPLFGVHVHAGKWGGA